MKKNLSPNAGFSLIEVIVVIAILSLMVGVGSYGISLTSGKQAQECANKLASAITHARTVTMGKEKTDITLRLNEKGQIEAIEQVTQNQVAEDGTITSSVVESTLVTGSRNVKISYSSDAGVTWTQMTDTTVLTFTFDRGSGALKKNDDGIWYTTLCIQSAGRTKYIMITPLTGRIAVTDSL